MLHGTAGSLENFAANIAPHAEHFNCIAFDMIGSGMTGKPDYDYETEHYVKHVADFFKATGIDKASIIGLSLGARVASRFAIDHPDKVDRLILLSATAYFPARPVQKDIKKYAGRWRRLIRRGKISGRSSKAFSTTKRRFGTISLRRGFRSIAGPT